MDQFAKAEDLATLERQTAYNTGEINRIKEQLKVLDAGLQTKANRDDLDKLSALVAELQRALS